MTNFQSTVNAVLNSGGNTATRICHLEEQIAAGVGDPALSSHIPQKCARAIVEGRISEGNVFGIVAGARQAKRPGAYFVSAIKRQFRVIGLPWRTEEWYAVTPANTLPTE